MVGIFGKETGGLYSGIGRRATRAGLLKVTRRSWNPFHPLTYISTGNDLQASSGLILVSGNSLHVAMNRDGSAPNFWCLVERR